MTTAPPPEIDAVYAAARRAAPALETVPPGPVDVGEGVWALALATPTLPPAAHTHAYVLGDREVVVVDPGAPSPAEQARLLDAIAARGGRVVRVALTHHHGDHVGGAAALAVQVGAPIAAHRDTAARLRGRVAVDEWLDDGDEVAPGWRAVFTPGHAPGHLCLWDERHRQACVGDMVAGVGTILIDPSEGDMSAYLASLQRLADLTPQRLLPAHGPMIDDGVTRLHAYAAHRLAREAKVLAAVRARPGATAAELVPVAYADTAVVAWPLAERSLRAHLVRLVGLGDVIEGAGAPVRFYPR